jgi:hypothetical protein
MLKICGRLKGLIPCGGLILSQSRKSAEIRAQPYSSGAHRPCSAKAITSCHKKNKSDWEEMRKEFKLLIEEGLKARIKETKSREGTKKSLAAELSKGGK